MERARGEARWRRVCLSMYSITENIYYTQLSSVAILLQPDRNCFTSYNTRKGLGSLSLCAIALRSFPPSHVSTCNSQRSSLLFCVRYMSILYGVFLLISVVLFSGANTSPFSYYLLFVVMRVVYCFVVSWCTAQGSKQGQCHS
jgi:hypothetical protein